MATMKTFDEVALDERKHFCRCVCGTYFDMRDLNQVLLHEHKDLETVKFSFSKKVEMVPFNKDKA